MANYTTMTCKTFAAFTRSEYRIKVDDNGAVSVYDDVAGHYTTCHSLSVAARRRAAPWPGGPSVSARSRRSG